MSNGRPVVICCLSILIQAALSTFIEISLPVTMLAPILNRQCSEIGGTRSSCHKRCQQDQECHGYITSRITNDPCTCRYISFPLCMLQGPVQNHLQRKKSISHYQQRSYRAAIKSSRHLPEGQATFVYPGHSPVFQKDFKVEFLERQIVWKSGKKFVRSSFSESISSGDTYDLSPTNKTNEPGISINSQLGCTELCKESRDQFGKSCAMAFESTINFSDLRVEICRLFDIPAASNVKTLEFTDQVKSAGGFQVSDVLTVFSSKEIRNNLCLSPVRWGYQKIIVSKNSTSDDRLPQAPNDSGTHYAGKPEASPNNPADHTSNASNGSDNTLAQAVLKSIERRDFWSRFAFCAIIPLSLVTIAIFSSVLACRYSKTQLNGQLAQFWRWERAGIPSNDFRPADDDDARSLIF